MYNLFTDTPPEANFAPWTHVASNIPLNQGVTTARNIKMSPIEKAWAQAKTRIFEGKMRKPDSEDPDVVNHWLWYTSTGFQRPYPGESKVRWPSDFAKNIAHPNMDLDD
jgi:hypothetical protein